MKDRLFTKNTKLMIVLTVLLFFFMLSVSGYIFTRSRRSIDKDIISFVYKENDSIHICPYETDGKYYLFLPSGFKIDDFRVYYRNNVVDGILSDNMLRVDADKTYDIEIVKIEDTATVFMDVKIGSIDEVNADKDKKTSARVKVNVFSDDAGMDISENATIKGRGNTSWLFYDKKPYNISFDQPVSVLGMNDARKWCMITNVADKYMIDDAVIYDFAKELDLEYSPDFRFVNVYIDGEYNGLYLITEKIEVDQNRLDIDRHDTYLVETDLNLQIDRLVNYFVTKGNNIFEIHYPKVLNDSRFESIESDIQEMEEAFTDPESERWKELIDVESWARIYLIDELFENVDGGFCSVYMYKGNDGLIHRGPLWDYDRSFAYGSRLIMAANEFKQANQINISYNHYLIEREEFREVVLDLLKNEFEPLLESHVKKKIKEFAEITHTSLIADQIRWHDDIDKQYHYDQMNTFLDDRMEFLIDYYSNKDKYCKVQIEGEQYYLNNYVVQKGSKVNDIEDLDESLLEDELYYKDSGERFEVDDVINEDICLVKNLERSELVPDIYTMSRYDGIGIINIVFMLSFVICFIVLINVIRLINKNG